jgi:hypothetical protein
MDFHAAIPITQMFSSTLSAINNVRDLARESSDRELKEKISEAYDGILSLKERMLTMNDEIRDLKFKLAKKAPFTDPEPPYGYIYRTDDTAKERPLCPACLRKDGGENYLDVTPWDDGYSRSCRACH